MKAGIFRYLSNVRSHIEVHNLYFWPVTNFSAHLCVQTNCEGKMCYLIVWSWNFKRRRSEKSAETEFFRNVEIL